MDGVLHHFWYVLNLSIFYMGFTKLVKPLERSKDN